MGQQSKKALLLAILGLHVLTAAYSVAGGQATRVEREEFGGINLIIWLIIEATAETNRT